MNRTGAQVITDWLNREGIGAVFLVPGLQIDPLFDALARSEGFRTIVASHELAAGFMADGYARASHGLGFCAGIGTVGSGNMLTAAMTARADDSAVLFLSGNVPWRLRGRGAFQDAWASGTNDADLFRKALIHVATVRSVSGLHGRLVSLASAMRHPHRTPAFLSVPHDVLQAAVVSPEKSHSASNQPHHDDVLPVLESSGVLARIAASRRPLVLAGPRAISADATTLLREFAETYNVPIATTLSAKGLVEETHPLSLGCFGYGGSRRANEALLHGEPDLLLLLGANWTERDSLCWNRNLSPAHSAILRIDPKRVLQRHELRADTDAHLDCTQVLRCLLALRGTRLRPLRQSASQRQQWLDSLQAIPRTDKPISALPVNGEGLPLDYLVPGLRNALPDDAILVVDAGLHRVFGAHHWICRKSGTFFSASSLAPMGWAIAASVGIQLARPRQPVVVLTGDGCLRAHGIELATMVRHQLPITVVVCNNRSYASIGRRFDTSSLTAAMSALPAVDWAAFARAQGADAVKVHELEGLRCALHQVFDADCGRANRGGRPTLVDVTTPPEQLLPGPDIVCSALSAPDERIPAKFHQKSARRSQTPAAKVHKKQ